MNLGKMQIADLNARIQKDKAFDHMRLCSKFVPGDGPIPAQTVLVGDVPGANENAARRPFMGVAGRLLDDVLGQNALDRRDMYVTNVLKYRPPDGRAPSITELMACVGHIKTEVAYARPLLVVLCGAVATQTFLPGARVSVVHGRPIRHGGLTYVSVFHPAVALRNPEVRQYFEADLAKVKQLTNTPRMMANA